MRHIEILVGIILLSAIFVLLIKRLKARKKALTPGNSEDAAIREGSSDVVSDDMWSVEELEFGATDIGTDDAWQVKELEFGAIDVGTDDAWSLEELEFDTAEIGLDEE